MNKLKPCPFCGEPVFIEDYLDNHIRDRHRVYCVNCKTYLELNTMWHDKSKLIEIWNKRV